VAQLGRHRAEPREIAELKRLKATHPQLATAVDLQIELLELQRRVQSRVPLPWLEFEIDWVRRELEAGRPLLRFEDIPLNWTDFSLMFRETASLLHRYDNLSEEDCRRAMALCRERQDLRPVVLGWFEAPRQALHAGRSSDPAPGGRDVAPEVLDQVLLLAMRPFLERCAEVAAARTGFEVWQGTICPLCAGDPEFALITPQADRLLVCGRCSTRWRAHPFACPFCQNADRARITSFASRDTQYRIYACEVCRRYLKAFDGRRAGRPLMLAVDTVATLPLDAATMQRGYTG
jgi:hypothetical protein